MNEIRKRLERQQREVQDFCDRLLIKAALQDRYSEFSKADAYRNAAIFLEVAWHNIFMAVQTLEEIRDE